METAKKLLKNDWKLVDRPSANNAASSFPYQQLLMASLKKIQNLQASGSRIFPDQSLIWSSPIAKLDGEDQATK